MVQILLTFSAKLILLIFAPLLLLKIFIISSIVASLKADLWSSAESEGVFLDCIVENTHEDIRFIRRHEADPNNSHESKVENPELHLDPSVT